MSCGCSPRVKCTCSTTDCVTTCPNVCTVLTVSNSWNMPACGSSAILAVDGLTSVLVGAYVYNPDVGYLRITGFNSLNGQITVENECIDGNIEPGATIPADTEFIFASAPSTAATTILSSWVVPACSASVVVTISGRSSIVIGSYIYTPAFGWFQITAFDPDTNLLTIKNNCSTGNAAAGTAVVAGTVFIFTDPPYNTEFIYNGGTSAGSANAQTITFVSTATAYFTGMKILFKAGLSSTVASPTVDVNGFGPIVLVDQTLVALPANVIRVNVQYEILYNGTNFVVVSPASTPIITYSPTLTTDGTGAFATNVFTESNWQFDFTSRSCSLNLLFSTSMAGLVTATYVAASLPFTASNSFTIPAYVNDVAAGSGNAAVSANTTVRFKKDVAGTAYSASTGRIFGVEGTFKVT